MKNFITLKTGFYRLCFLLLFGLLGFQQAAFSQAQDSKGTDFWLMFNKNYSTPTLTLFITSDVNTSGTVTIPGMAFSASFTVTANTVTSVAIPEAASEHTSGVVDGKGIHVTSGEEVTVYGLNYAPFTTDAYLGLPTDVLGTSYIIMSYSGQTASEFGITGTVNGTTVTITQNITGGGHTAGVPYNVTLDQGQTLEVGGNTDYTGTLVTSDKPIGVMGANGCANIPPGYSYCDHICEMLPPTTTWGKKFGLVPLKSRSNGDTWRFMASENGTVVSINGVAEPAVNKGQYVEKVITVQSVVESNKPILAAQFSNGSTFSGEPGDPFMMLIPPLEQFLPKYTVTTVSGYVAHYINLIAPNAIVGSLSMDGVVVPAGSFTPIGSTGFSGAQLTVDPGTHNLQGTLPFGVFIYGFNQDDSYGYPGGQSFSAIATVTSVVLSPKTGTAAIGTVKCFDALVKDQFSNPVPGVRVDFGITGTNPGSSGFAFTNASGVATFCYSGPTAGVDNIVASVGTITDNGTFTWTPGGSANDFYSKAAGDLHNTATWGMNPDGSGTSPADFAAGKTFHLVNRVPTYTMTGDWTVNGKLDIPSGSVLSINGYSLGIADLLSTGKFAGSTTSNLTVAGTAGGDANISFTAAGDMLNSFTLNRTGTSSSATLGAALDVFGVLTLQNGMLNTGNFLTLKSNAAGTARVAPVTGSVSGNVTAERYIPARRAWRIVSAPVGGSQTVNAAWQEGATTSSVTPNPHPGFGTHITEGDAAAGLDHNPLTAMSSLKKYLSSADNWKAVPNTYTALAGTDAYMLFVRGDRGVALGYNSVPATNTTLRATGTLKTGDQTFAVAASGFTGIPNPFASPINFTTLSRTNVQNNFYLWDPKMGGASGVGGYVLLSYNGSGYDVTPAPVSPESELIQSGQGFLVQSTGTAGTLVIKESDKSATAATNVFRATADAAAAASRNNAASLFNTDQKTIGLRTALQVRNDDGTTAVADEVLSAYGASYSNRVDDLDALKPANFNENIGIVRDGKTLMIERRQGYAGNDTISLKIWNTTPGNYELRFSPSNLSGSTFESAFVEDRYLHATVAVSLSSVTTIPFTIGSDEQSAMANRFVVVMVSSGKGLLPVVGANNGIRVSPNPVTGNVVNVQFTDQPKGTYHISMVNALGQIIFNNEVKHPGGTATQTIQLGNGFAKGVYRMRVVNSSSNINLTLPLVMAGK